MHTRRAFLATVGLAAGTALVALTGCQSPPAATATPNPAPTPAQSVAPTAPPAAGNPTAAPAQSSAHASTTSSAAGQPKTGGQAVLAIPVEVVNYDPFLGAGTHGYMLARGVYNTLTRYDNHLKPQPELASSWQFSSDGLQITLNLRHGVKFHSGREFTADDVVFTLQKAQDPTYAALNRGLVAPLSATAKDKYTVVFSTKTPYAAVFDALDGLFIIDKDTAQPHFLQKAVGTGPFKQGARVPGDYARFDRFDGYWNKPAYLDSFELKTMSDIQARAINFESKAIDMVWQLDYPDYIRLQKTNHYDMLPGAEGAIYYDITINTTRPTFKDKRVRQAINWSIDRQRFVNVVLKGIVAPTSIPFPKASFAYDEALATKFHKDLNQAKSLLKQAGADKGFTATLMTSSKRTPGFSDLAQMLQADLKTVGVNLTIQDLEPTVYDRNFPKGEFDIALHTFGRANKDPATLFGGAIVWYTNPKTNPSHFQSDQYAKLVEQGATTIDVAKRKEIYHQITLLIQDECFCIPVASQPRVFGTQKYVQDFAYTLDNMPLWHRLWLNK